METTIKVKVSSADPQLTEEVFKQMILQAEISLNASGLMRWRFDVDKPAEPENDRNNEEEIEHILAGSTPAELYSYLIDRDKESGEWSDKYYNMYLEAWAVSDNNTAAKFFLVKKINAEIDKRKKIFINE